MAEDAWQSRIGFILAALGSAVGLGNIWRFPFVAYRNGGGAFLIPYAVAILAIGLTLMLAEFALGHRYRSSQPRTFGQTRPGWEGAGWFPIAVGMFGVTLYYCVVIGWTVNYFFYSFTLAWEPKPETLFFKTFLGLTKDPAQIGGLRWPIVLSTAFVWLASWWIVSRGIAKGLERAIKIMMPVMIILIFVLMIWSFSLPGAGAGLTAYLKPDFSKLLDLRVWGEAVGQTFLSLSLGFGIMVAYASYLPKEANLPANALWVVLGDTLFAVAGGMIVFATLGFMAHSAGVGVEKVVKGGPGLVFVVFPKAISSLPGMRPAFGALFFLALFIAGLSSALSLIEALASAIQDKFNVPRRRLVSATCCLGFAGSLIFTTGAGLLWLDIVDHHMTQYGLLAAGIMLAIFVGWMVDTNALAAHMREHGSAWVGRWWPWVLRYPIPALLSVLLISALIADIKKTYGGYPLWAILVFGWGWLAALAVAAFWMGQKKGDAPRRS